MKTIINLDNFKVIGSEEWVLYLDNTPYDYEENKDKLSIMNQFKNCSFELIFM